MKKVENMRGDELVKAIAKTYGLKIPEIAFYIKVHPITVWRWHGGKMMPHAEFMKKLRELYENGPPKGN